MRPRIPIPLTAESPEAHLRNALQLLEPTWWTMLSFWNRTRAVRAACKRIRTALRQLEMARVGSVPWAGNAPMPPAAPRSPTETGEGQG